MKYKMYGRRIIIMPETGDYVMATLFGMCVVTWVADLFFK